jgi:Bacterial Ig domain
MAHVVRIWTLALCLTALSAATAFPQTSSDISSAATPSAGVAYVYVGSTKGVYLYNAASNGSLSLVSGSPFSVAGNAVGSNGKYFVSLGTAYLHSYPVASNGAIKGQVSQINTQSYSGSACGGTYGGIFDHTGQDLYVQRNTPSAECTALQSFKISSAGAFTFLGATEFNQTITSTPTLIALTGNGAFGYSFAGVGFCSTSTYAFQRESSGAMILDTNISNSLATPPPDFQPLAGTADPTNHFAIAGSEEPDSCTFETPQLASYTVASNGTIVSTNTTANMPTPEVTPAVMNMSPSGQFLAVGGNNNQNPEGIGPLPGLQIFHFNGANPITPLPGALTRAPIDEIHWDNNNHLYALSNSTGKLYAYTVTSSGITIVPGSPYSIASPNALVVVPTSAACSAPSSNGVHICAPASGSTVSSPVLVEASSTVTGTIARMELWVDGVKKYTATSSKQLNTTISLAAGSHRFAVLATNTAGQTLQSAVSATVK